MIANIIYFILWLLLWSGLCWPVSRQDFILGFLVSLFITSMTGDLATHFDDGSPKTKHGFVNNIKRAGWFLYYIIIFLWECIRGNIDVAYRVLHPDLRIRPGTVKVKIGLKSDIGLTFLANSITLTPGTTTVDVDKKNGYLYVHWIYVKDEYLNSAAEMPLVTRFENILKKVFE